MPLPSQESEWSWSGIDVASFYDFPLDFELFRQLYFLFSILLVPMTKYILLSMYKCSHIKKIKYIIVLCICRQLILTLFHMIQVLLNDDSSCLIVYCSALHTTISFLESNVFINHAIIRNNTSKYISEILIYIILVILKVTIEVCRYQRVNINIYLKS